MKYSTAAAFRMALERRALDKARRRGIAADRVVVLFLFERLLTRLILELGDSALTVKGGVALELRLTRARTTRDLDLRALGDPESMLERLRAAGRADADDYLRFDITATGDIEGDGVVYEGRRYKVQAFLGGKAFRQPFGLDVAFGDVMLGAPDRLPSLDTLGLIDGPPGTLPVYPIGAHLAEKLHAYTLPRKTPNGRVRDLVDIALVGGGVRIDAAELRAALAATFSFRKTHRLPEVLPRPPEHWSSVYPDLARKNDLAWRSIDDVFVDAARFVDPVLAGAPGIWDAATRDWRT